MSQLFKLPTLCLLLVTLMMNACVSDDDGIVDAQDCSVSDRCNGQPDLAIRLRQVETLYFENEDSTSTSLSDLARFDYNPQNQWIAGDTTRVADSDIAYTLEYNSNGTVNRLNRIFTDDFNNKATVILEYFYIGNQLDKSESATTITNENDVVQKTIDELINYTFFADGRIEEITFDVMDSDPGIGNSNFSYEFIYNNANLLTDIIVLDSSVSANGYVFQSFSYTNNSVSASTTFRLNLANEPIESETSTYEYFPDGPIRRKTSLTNTLPKQRVETSYTWEAADCATNQTFGDRLFPSPELPNFPCL